MTTLRPPTRPLFCLLEDGRSSVVESTPLSVVCIFFILYIREFTVILDISFYFCPFPVSHHPYSPTRPFQSDSCQIRFWTFFGPSLGAPRSPFSYRPSLCRSRFRNSGRNQFLFISPDSSHTLPSSSSFTPVPLCRLVKPEVFIFFFPWRILFARWIFKKYVQKQSGTRGRLTTGPTERDCREMGRTS